MKRFGRCAHGIRGTSLTRRSIGAIVGLTLTLELAACGGADPSRGARPDAPAPAPSSATPPVTDGAHADLVTLGDEALAACVRGALGIPAGGPITRAAMDRLTLLSCPRKGIRLLDGLEAATNLRELSLWENLLTDLGPLAGLTALENLELGHNRIHDAGPLAGLTALDRLGLSDNLLESLDALTGMTRLRWLHLDRNPLDHASTAPLRGMPGLVWLTAEKASLGHLDALRTQFPKAEVYSAPPPAPKPPAEAAGHALVASPRLAVAVAPSGDVSFLAGGAPAPFESPGTLTLEGARYHYRLGTRDVVVGEADGKPSGPCEGAYAQACGLTVGVKTGEGDPVVTVALSLREGGARFRAAETRARGSFSSAILPYVLAAPNQHDAGSCLFMANTGAVEILLGQLGSASDIQPNGVTDLSERFLMAATDDVPAGTFDDVITDVSRSFGALGGAMLNRDYPFAMDYVKDDAQGNPVPAHEGDTGADLSCRVNWIDKRPADWRDRLVEMPAVDRTLLFVDPAGGDKSVWDVGVMGADVVDRIKYEVRSKEAPVVIVYNHFTYWHAVMIVGYDDNEDSGDCSFVRKSVAYYRQKKDDALAKKVEDAMAAGGGCSHKGMFYVRDSIYDGADTDPTYDYGPTQEKYSARIIKHDYNWPRYLGNHAYVVHR